MTPPGKLPKLQKSPERMTIREVAMAAGVSNSSVSNYMNERLDRLGPEARARIGDAIKRLDFQPNQAARQLKTGKTRGIALVVPSIVNPFSGELVLLIEQAAVKAGYGVHLCNTMRDPEVETEFLDKLLGIGVRDLITVSPLNTTCGAFYSMRDNLSVVTLDASRDDMKLPQLSTVNLDHEAAIRLAVEHLCGLGHRRIVYVTDPLITHSRVTRFAGFKKAMGAQGLAEGAVVMLEGGGVVADMADTQMVYVGRRAAARIAALVPRPTAVIAFNDMIALGLLASFRTSGISVPDEVSLVGIDDIWISQILSPGLTSVRQPIEAMATAAVSHIVSPDGAGSDTVFLPELVVRDTCARPKAEASTRLLKRPTN